MRRMTTALAVAACALASCGGNDSGTNAPGSNDAKIGKVQQSEARGRSVDELVERRVPIVFMVIGLLMVVAAAFVDMVDGLAITFAVLGVGLIALGGLVPLT